MRIIDSHTHLTHGQPEKLLELAEHYGYEKFNVLGIPCSAQPLNTLECLLLKRLAPDRVYVYGGMEYAGVEPTARSHERQLELMLDAGCDGWKILESKPSVYRALQLPLDGEVFSRAFALAEREHVPIIWHAGDPATFWDADRAPEFAKVNHWLCIGEGFPSLEAIYSQVENVLARHPDLRASMAHLYFTSDDRAHAERLFAMHEHIWLDLTPGTEMYHDFLADREGWRAFFEKYQDRLVFGTDMEDHEDGVDFGDQASRVRLMQCTLAGDQPFSACGASGVGLGLPESVLEKILALNFARRNPPTPKPLSAAGIHAYAEWLLPQLPAEQQARCEALLGQLT